MFCKYSGNGNSTPSVLTVATSLPVDGFSPGSGATLGVVRGAASRLVLSVTGGGGAGDTVLFGDLAFGAGAGLASAGRSTASGALRASSVGSRAATRCTRYVGGTGLRAAAPPATRNNPFLDRKSTRLNSSHSQISYAAFCLQKKNRSSTRCCPSSPPEIRRSTIEPRSS